MTTRSIGSNSRYYSSIQAWEDDCPSDLVSATDVWIGELYNDSEFLQNTQVTFSGTTTNATYYQWLRCASGQSFTDHADKDTNPLYYDQSKGVGIRCTHTGYSMSGILYGISQPNVRFTGLQIFSDTTSNGQPTTQIATGDDTILEHCLFVKRGSGGQCVGVSSGYNDWVISNCSFHRTTNSSAGYLVYGDRSGDTIEFHNCTFVASGTSNTVTAFRLPYQNAAMIVKNCAFFGCANILTGSGSTSFNSASDYNATDLSTVPTNFGSNSQTGLTAANQFENIASDLRVKAGSDLIDAGARDQTYTSDLDIAKRSRSTTTPTVGAWEYIAAGGAPTLSSATVINIGQTQATPRVTVTF